jgi:uncharacterized cupin superfamily protein
MLLSISSMWLRATLSAPIPFWLFLFVLSLGLFTAVELYRYWKISSDLRKRNDALESQRKNAEAHDKALEASKEKLEATIREVRTEKQHLQQQFAELQAEKHRQEQQIAELTSRGPRLHGVWSNSQSFWHMDRKGAEQVMQIGGRIQLTSSNTDEVLHLLAGYIEGQRLDLSEPVSIRPDLIEDEQVVLCMKPAPEADVTRSFTATIVLEDHQNRLHTLPRHSFRPTEQAPPWSTEH